MRSFNAMHPDVCADCGAVVFDERAHDRFHEILNDHAGAIAATLVTHESRGLHEQFDLADRVRAKAKGNNWSAEAFTEVTGVTARADESERA